MVFFLVGVANSFPCHLIDQMVDTRRSRKGKDLMRRIATGKAAKARVIVAARLHVVREV